MLAAWTGFMINTCQVSAAPGVSSVYVPPAWELRMSLDSSAGCVLIWRWGVTFCGGMWDVFLAAFLTPQSSTEGCSGHPNCLAVTVFILKWHCWVFFVLIMTFFCLREGGNTTFYVWHILGVTHISCCNSWWSPAVHSSVCLWAGWIWVGVGNTCSGDPRSHRHPRGYEGGFSPQAAQTPG